MAQSKKVKYKFGDVVAIPMTGSRFAFAKMLKVTDFAVYDFISNNVEPVSVVTNHNISFYQACTDQAVTRGEWPIIGNEAFNNLEEEWGPPRATCYLRETNEWTMGGVPRVQHKGQMNVTTLEAVRGLDIFTVCNRPDQILRIIEDRLINGNHADYKVIG